MNSSTTTAKVALPSIYSFVDTQDYWMIDVQGLTRRVTINQPVKDEFTGWRRGSGVLDISPPLNGISRVPFGHWKISADYEKRVAGIKNARWVLVLNTRRTNQDAWKRTEIGFMTKRSNDERQPLRSWVTMINNRFKRTMLKSSPK